ncbi:MAG: T9SS type A sorting domain-containing protein [Flavobacteriaceae bacterium]|nr:T9SS type A sorting domain-containing protein [Flavobacteriaceae bacterium]
MKKITLLVALFAGVTSFAQVASTSFEEELIIEDVNDGKYFDLGDANVAHDLVNNPLETPVDQSGGTELSVDARYVPYDTPGSGLVDGDFVGVTTFTPSGDLGFTDGDQGYQISDTDGTMILEFGEVDLTGVSSPSISMDFILSINGDGTNGNYEGDGTVNESGSDRLRIYVKDLTNNTEIDLFNSTGSDLDDLVPTDGSGLYILEWQEGTADLLTGTTVQLVVEARVNSGGEVFFIDNIVFDGSLGANDLNNSKFSIYPNPATQGFVNITSQLNGDKEVAVYNVLGKQVINTTIANERLNIAGLSSGIYIVKVTQDNISATKKLVVK